MVKRVRASVAALAVTAVAVAGMAAAAIQGMSLATENVARVRTCQVTSGQVEQVLAVTGRVRYEAEYAVISPQDGIVERIYVRPGDSVMAGQALFRLDGAAQEAALSAALTYGSEAGEWAQAAPAWADTAAVERAARSQAEARVEEAAALLHSMTVRAPADGMVQAVDIAEHGGVLAGTPAVAMSGVKQSILCSVAGCDAAKLHPGMRARLIHQGAQIRWATVADISAVQVSAATGQSAAEVRLVPESNLPLPLGTALETEIILDGREQVPTLPVEAVTRQGTVWWVAEGRCWETPVEVVMADELNCWVNLPEGLTIICGEETVEGQRVKEMKP